MDYLGFLNDIDLESLPIEERNEILVSKGLFSKSLSIPINTDGTFTKIASNNAYGSIEPSIELSKAFYIFITKTYDQEIMGIFLDFSYSFNNEVYGFDHSEKKKTALGYFKEYIDDVSENTIAFLNLLKLENGSERIENQNKIEIMYDKQNALKINLINNAELLNNYLMGNKAWFTFNLVDEIEILSEVIDFESKLKIILGLNEQFLFEKDSYFKKPQIEKSSDETKITPTPQLKLKKKPLLSGEKAIEYLLKNVFNHK